MQVSTKPVKSVIITGGNSGLGYYCAEAIAQSGQDWHIIIASRNLPRVEAAVRKLMAETEYPHIEGMALDLASLASVRQFAQDFITGERPPLQAIVCNAGLQVVSDTLYTEDGFEMTFGVNHLGHFLLVNLLLPQLSDRSRIAFVSSDVHDPDKNTGMPHPHYQNAKALAFPMGHDNQMNIGNTGRVRYTTSKLCNVLCAYELSRRLKQQQSKITVNVFNPGLMGDTQLARDYSQAEISTLMADISPSVIEQAKDSKTMGGALARLILDRSLNHVTGKYFDGLEETRSSDESYDEQKAAELWESSAELVKIH
ncbi:SDR family NAD(P)-dependent oxidoreductase [Nostoc sp. MG11]|uniref:SDR family NAD(P)-dependent oxidoreductase n=1 Tax=Nostoc sp. MG11 TaxID=2721166 RepID=UPI001866AD11|nr:SDR family NAD(P)-dependent oxidoreductase [Nostoc sp. MG11]